MVALDTCTVSCSYDLIAELIECWTLRSRRCPASLFGHVAIAILLQVKNRIVESGVHAKGPLPLSYAWHDKEYLGAAHGWAGILFQLMRVRY